MASKVKVLVMTGYGLNCERETTRAFELAGAEVTCVHLNDLFATSSMLLDFHVLAFIGGFSFGDHLGAGTVLAKRALRCQAAGLRGGLQALTPL